MRDTLLVKTQSLLAKLESMTRVRQIAFQLGGIVKVDCCLICMDLVCMDFLPPAVAFRNDVLGVTAPCAATRNLEQLSPGSVRLPHLRTYVVDGNLLSLRDVPDGPRESSAL